MIAFIFGIWWLWKNDYLSWSIILDSISLDGLKETVLTIFSEPMFIGLYLAFVFIPIWVLGKYIAPTLPLYYKIGASIGGIWAVNLIMDKKGLR